MAQKKKQSENAEKANLVHRLAQIGIALSLERNPDRLLEMILLEAKAIANADGGTLYFLNDYDQLEYEIVRTDSLNISYGGEGLPAPTFAPVRIYDAITGEPNLGTQVVAALVQQRPINIDDVYATEDFDFRGTKAFDTLYGYRTTSVLTIPMVNHKHEAIGCLQLINALDEHGQTIPFSEDIAQIVQALASQAAVILDNKQLIAGQRNLLEAFIKIIAQSIDAKSPYTGNHCERVPLLTEMLAEAACATSAGQFKDFNLNEEEKYELHIAGWLHDCGKIVTPVHIMDKATKLETIHDRIHEVIARVEVLRRDVKIAHLEGKISESECRAQDAMLANDAAFLRKVNMGSEFLEDAAIDRIRAIALREVTIDGNAAPLLSEEEVDNLSIRKGTITPQERQIMNDHMVHTVNMLESMPWPKHLRRVPEYACGHHEKMDGTGYPRGLLAGTMSVPARMMAVADVFEALTASDRPYKPAKKLSESMTIIGNLKKANHLDPGIVDFFVTSGVYKRYAQMYLSPELIDDVNEQAILNIIPEPMQTKRPRSE